MALKYIVLLTFLLVVLTPSQTKAQVTPTRPLIGVSTLITINGTIFCSLNGTIVVNGSNPTPPFANAQVNLVCGRNVIASTRTNEAGAFTLIVNAIRGFLASLLSSCRIVVATPLSTCNATLPSTGNLTGSLVLVNVTPQGITVGLGHIAIRVG
ncbi:hypothetical protein M8C21_011107 [Ambrosia artemisiifolia]|uniref:Uncharacterized protein n=1 Tax=Ambrosia artemisiifolia TaxID=4212 RepID=A0AAD5DEM8_AMBAR|nr:hypothetical protein M8C21_011107 [Ambrosia artemisiifolia]